MPKKRIRVAAAFAAMLTAAALLAAPLRARAAQGELIEKLRDLIREGEQKRAADRWFLDGLRGLVQRYGAGAPGLGRVIFRDDFRDGDYTRSPEWRVVAGRFEVTFRSELTSDVRAGSAATAPRAPAREPAPARGGDLASAILGELLRAKLEKKRSREPEPAPPPAAAGHAEICASVKIPNTFSIQMEIVLTGAKGRLVLGPYDGSRRDRGYRLAFSPGDKIGLELYRATRRGTDLLAAHREPLKIEAGRAHLIEWTREGNGQMKVALDGVELLRAADTQMGGVFNGFSLVNFEGRFGLREIVITGP
jgi:hypothetical protein